MRDSDPWDRFVHPVRFLYSTCVNIAYLMYLYGIKLSTNGSDKMVTSLLFKTLVVLEVT